MDPTLLFQGGRDSTIAGVSFLVLGLWRPLLLALGDFVEAEVTREDGGRLGEVLLSFFSGLCEKKNTFRNELAWVKYCYIMACNY